MNSLLAQSEARPESGTRMVGGECEQPEEIPDLEEIYARHFSFIWRSVRGLGVPEATVDDAVQDVFVVVYRKLSEYRAEASLKSWLFGIARRVASDYRRSAKRKPTTELDDLVQSDEALVDERAISRQILTMVERFLEGLEEENRALYVLVQVEGLSTAEASQILSLNPNTAYSRLKIMKQRLSTLLAAVEGEMKP